MHICNYCGRLLKGEYETCPGCGGNSFKNTAFLGETVIKEPPKGGYKINLENYKKSMRTASIVTIIGVVLLVMPLLFALPFLLLGITEVLLFGPFELIIGIILIAVGVSNKKKIKKSMTKANKLAKNGMLVKAVPYKEINTGTYVMGKYYKCIEVKFKNSAGVEIPLYSETKYDADIKNPETVDLLIDPNDYSNYFIDYEIY